MRYFLYTFMLIFSFAFGAQAETEWEKIRTSFNESMNSKGGTSESIETEFGNLRLISCRTGIKSLSGLTAGVEVALKPGWILKTIDLNPTAENAKADILPVFQENRTPSQGWTTDYQKSTIFPIWLYDLKNQDVPLTVFGKFEACSLNTYKCIHVAQFLNLMLPAGEAYPTLSCGAIQYALKNAAFDITKTKVQAENQLLPNGDLKIRLIFPKDVQQIDLQSLNIPLDLIFKKTDGVVFTGILHPQNTITVGDEIPLNIRSNNGCFKWNLVVTDKELPPVRMPLPFGFGFWSGILFFFLSPLWVAWMMPNKIENNPALFRKKIRAFQLIISLGIFGLGLCWISGLNPFTWIQNQIMAWLVLGMLLVLLVKPLPMQLWVIGILVFIFPRPFGEILNKVAFSTKIYLLIWWTICAYIPFNIWLLAPKSILSFFKDTQSQNIPAYKIIVRLPYMILIGWLGLSLTGFYHFKIDPIYQPGKTKGPAIVQVVNPVCLTCVKDRAFFLSHFKNHLYRIASDSEWAKEKRKLYQITEDTFYIYIKRNGQEVVFPQNLTRSKLSKILSD